MTHDQNERVYLLYILKNTDFFKKTKHEFFRNDTLKSLYKLCKSYYEKFKHIPETNTFKKTLKQLVSNPKYIAKNGDSVTTDDIDSLFTDTIDEYDDKWVLNAIEGWIRIRDFEIRLTNGVKYIKTQEVTPENADDAIRKTLSIFNDSDINLENNKGIDFFDASKHEFSEEEKISSGRPFVDRLLNGGYDKKTIVFYIGQQGVGKSSFFCNDAAHFVRSGKNVVYVSAEMSEKKVMKRIGAIMFNISLKEYEKASKKEGYIQSKIDAITGMGIELGNLRIVQMADPNVIDVESYCKQVEREIKQKVDVVIVDYIGIMSDYRSKNSMDMYLKSKNISKDLRDIGITNDWLMISGAQIGKEQWDSSTMTIKAIAESSAIAHNADLVYGIIQDPDMAQEDTFWLKILKIRDGDGRNTKCKYQRNSRTLANTETSEIKIDSI